MSQHIEANAIRLFVSFSLFVWSYVSALLTNVEARCEAFLLTHVKNEECQIAHLVSKSKGTRVIFTKLLTIILKPLNLLIKL